MLKLGDQLLHRVHNEHILHGHDIIESVDSSYM